MEHIRKLFSADSAKSSVIDLAAKCKHLRGLQKELGAQIRAGEKNPSVPWGKDKFGEPINIHQSDVDEKRAYRSGCSRAHQLAYAFIRGVPYRAVEEHTTDRDLHYGIVDALKDHLNEEGRAELKGMLEPGNWWGSPFRKVLLGAVQAWLAEDPPHLALIRGVGDLNHLILKGLGEGEVADKLRDELDVLWEALDDRQRAWARRRADRMAQQRDAAQERLRAAKGALAKRGAA